MGISAISPLKENLPFADDEVLDYVTASCRRPTRPTNATPRATASISRFGMKLSADGKGRDKTQALETAIVQTLGREALRYVSRG